MKIGLLAYSSKTGLGYQTRDFYKNIECEKVLIADISKLNGMPVDHSWVNNARISDGIPSNIDMEWLVDGMDLIFVCETPLNHYLFDYAKKKGVPTVLQYNFEFLPYFKKPELPKPTIFASPSMWGIEKVKASGWGQVIHWPVPINVNDFKFRKIKKVETISHIIGRPAHSDRNGTLTFLEVARRQKQYNYITFLQRPREGRVEEHFRLIDDDLKRAIDDGVKLEVIEDVEDNREMYTRGDIMLLPRRYGGLCLPMWEALATGIPVVMPKISPNETILPEGWLADAEYYSSFMAHTNISVFTVRIDSVIQRINHVRNFIFENNKIARQIAEGMSWDLQRENYINRFRKICESYSIKK